MDDSGAGATGVTRAGGVLMLWALAVGLAACSWSSYNKPPTAGAVQSSDDSEVRPVVVIGRFEDSSHPPYRWRDIGSGMSEALSKALLREGEVEVWIDPTLASRASKLVTMPAERRQRGLRQIQSTQGMVDFVVIGEVTDFTHSTELSEEVETLRMRLLALIQTVWLRRIGARLSPEKDPEDRLPGLEVVGLVRGDRPRTVQRGNAFGD